MLIWIIIAVIIVLAFIAGYNNPQPKQPTHHSKDLDIEPIFDDGEIVGWYEEKE